MAKIDKKRVIGSPKRFSIFLLLIVLMFFAGGAFANLIKAGGFNGEETLFKNPFVKDERLNILVFGVDAPDKESIKGTRSDSIMLLCVNSSGKNPVLISIPRDTRVEIPGRRYHEKINHAHAYGEEELLEETMEKLFNIDIDYYVRVNYKAVEEVVDALGGVEVDVPMDMQYTDRRSTPPLSINIKKGLQTLNGQEAVNFMRYRKGYANQDLGRIEAQQQFVSALKDKVLSPSVITKIPKLIDIFYDNVNTNIPKTKLVSLGSKAVGLQGEDIVRLTLPGTSKYINGISYYLPDEEQLKQIRNAHLLDEAEYVPTVEVLNGCGKAGIASTYKEKIEASNIQLEEVMVGNYTTSDVSTSFIEYSGKAEKKAKEIAKLLGIKKVTKYEGDVASAEIRVIIGEDLDK
ncbi:LCP family protein [Alkaliphilus hydrothermalis]|uniref:LCP family protein required for cell wall assembly n=1 Tax=Alkaliphilus hydrothermalis TaxID=1482730 RepID=A0ABS2NS76_9FIRM|nr:LCP family protein [Alkaliphilus hydrothermalis]MBM7615814.1 LCP family protein required for cell wall assembly [Alkaliphilus hydrothermalis]